MSAHEHHGHGERPASFLASPAEAASAPREEFVYLACLHEGTGVAEPDFLAVVDTHPDSDTYAQIIHETPMPNVGDELHHYGWNRCSSACHGPDRSHLIVPGFRSSRIHVVNVADDPRRPRVEKVIEPQEVVRETGYTRPHTVHCMPGDNVVVSMLGDADGNGAGGFAVLDAKTFEIKGRWENGGRRPSLNGGPQMLQLSYDGRRLYVTNSLYSTWDNQFYPGLRSWLLKVDCDPNGGMSVDRDFFVDFHDRPRGPARAHEVRLQGGDSTTEIFQ